MTRQRLNYLFNRYVTESISESEKAEFFTAVAQAENDPDLKQLIDVLWLSVPEEIQMKGTEEIFQKMILTEPRQEIKHSRSRWLKIAASISLLVIAAFAVYSSLAPVEDKKIAADRLITNKPHNSFLRLPDGSTVVLNAGSVLHYPKSFEGSGSRTVKLEGEAFFDIHHDSKHPFIVVSGNVVTTVLGTAFNVKAFPKDKEVTITVARGRVEVSYDKKSMAVLLHDQQVTIKNGVAKKDIQVNARAVTAWIESEIVFDDTTLKEAIEELENRFGVDINLIDEHAYECRFTGTFLRGENIEQILLVICEFNNVTMHQSPQTGVYEISGTGCN
jgi:transmembrane sensor